MGLFFDFGNNSPSWVGLVQIVGVSSVVLVNWGLRLGVVHRVFFRVSLRPHRGSRERFGRSLLVGYRIRGRANLLRNVELGEIDVGQVRDYSIAFGIGLCRSFRRLVMSCLVDWWLVCR